MFSCHWQVRKIWPNKALPMTQNWLGVINSSEGHAVSQTSLSRLGMWVDRNPMKFNEEKWKVLDLGRSDSGTSTCWEPFKWKAALLGPRSASGHLAEWTSFGNMSSLLRKLTALLAASGKVSPVGGSFLSTQHCQPASGVLSPILHPPGTERPGHSGESTIRPPRW